MSVRVQRAATDREPQGLLRRRRRVAETTVLRGRTRVALGIAGIIVVLGAWEAAYRLDLVSKVTGSSPSQIGVGARVLNDNHLLFPAIWSSTKLFLIGFSL